MIVNFETSDFRFYIRQDKPSASKIARTQPLKIKKILPAFDDRRTGVEDVSERVLLPTAIEVRNDGREVEMVCIELEDSSWDVVDVRGKFVVRRLKTKFKM